MSLRRRLALLSAAAVALAVLLASVIVYALVRDQLARPGRRRPERPGRALDHAARGRVQPGRSPPAETLPPVAQGGVLSPGRGAGRAQIPARCWRTWPEEVGDHRTVIPLPPPPPGGPPALGQFISANGEAVPAPGPRSRSRSRPTRLVAAETGEPSSRTRRHGTPAARADQPLADGVALQLARSLEDTEETLSRPGRDPRLVSAGGIALAAALGPVVARAALAPAGGGLGRRRGGGGDPRPDQADRGSGRRRTRASRGELQPDDGGAGAVGGRPAAAGGRRLMSSAPRSRPCVRTSRRWGAGRGRSARARPPGRDLTVELEELTDLVADVLELARAAGGGGLERGPRPRRAHPRRGGAGAAADSEFPSTSGSQRTLVRGDRQRLGRAISNLLYNASKWSPDGGVVEVEI